MNIGGQDIFAVLITVTIPTLFGLLVVTYRDQIRELKEENGTYRREFPNQTQAIKDQTQAINNLAAAWKEHQRTKG
jgi:FtsZ-binding cell division protein ZapB